LAASYTIREATAADIDSLVAFTLQEAREAEGYEANEAAVRCGVEGGFGERPLATYWVAECDGQTAGSVSVVREWSNFRGGEYWWIQSVFIVPEHRGTG
jgi:GNAT superfamily N-acetyltransferase